MYPSNIILSGSNLSFIIIQAKMHCCITKSSFYLRWIIRAAMTYSLSSFVLDVIYVVRGVGELIRLSLNTKEFVTKQASIHNENTWQTCKLDTLLFADLAFMSRVSLQWSDWWTKRPISACHVRFCSTVNPMKNQDTVIQIMATPHPAHEAVLHESRVVHKP